MNPRYRIGDQVFFDRDIGLPVVLRIEQAIPVREQGGYQKIVGNIFDFFRLTFF